MYFDFIKTTYSCIVELTQNNCQRKNCRTSHLLRYILLWKFSYDIKPISKYFLLSDLARRQKIEDVQSEKAYEKRKIRKDDSEDSTDSTKWRSLESQNSNSFGPISSASPDRKSSVESRSKVFRHKLQRIYSLDIRDWSVDAPNVVDRNDVNDPVKHIWINYPNLYCTIC